MDRIKSLLRLKQYLKGYKISMILGIVGMTVSSCITIPIPYIIGNLMDNLIVNKNFNGEVYKKIYMTIGVIALLYILGYITSIVSRFIFVRINNSITNELRYSVMKKFMNLNMSYLDNVQKGYIQSRISECSCVGGIFSPSFISFFLGFIDAIFAFVTMFVINSKLALVVMILFPFFFLSAKATAKNFVKNTIQMSESNAVLNGECFEIINGIEDIKILNGQRIHLKKFSDKIKKFVNSSITQSKISIIMNQSVGIVGKFGELIILLISTVLILKGQFTIGLYTSFSLYINKVFGIANGLATIRSIIDPVCVSIERLYELLEMDEENNGRSIYIYI